MTMYTEKLKYSTLYLAIGDDMIDDMIDKKKPTRPADSENTESHASSFKCVSNTMPKYLYSGTKSGL